MPRNFSAIIAGLLIAVAVAASPAQATIQDGEPVVGLPGMRDSEEPPVGDPIILPEGLELDQPILTYAFHDENDCKDPDEEVRGQAHGNDAALVHLCLVFRNNTGKPINLEFPPGTIFESESWDTQNGMVVQTASIEVPAKPVSYSLIKLDCTNVTRSAPVGHSGVRYRLGPVVRYPHIVEALQLLADRDLSYIDDALIAHAVLSELHSGAPLLPRHRTEIAALPAKQPPMQ